MWIIIPRLGQLASMAGIEQSDFGLLGDPQLSSTERRGQGDQGNEQRKEDIAVSGIYLSNKKNVILTMKYGQAKFFQLTCDALEALGHREVEVAFVYTLVYSLSIRCMCDSEGWDHLLIITKNNSIGGIKLNNNNNN